MLYIIIQKYKIMLIYSYLIYDKIPYHIIQALYKSLIKTLLQFISHILNFRNSVISLKTHPV